MLEEEPNSADLPRLVAEYEKGSRVLADLEEIYSWVKKDGGGVVSLLGVIVDLKISPAHEEFWFCSWRFDAFLCLEAGVDGEGSTVF